MGQCTGQTNIYYHGKKDFHMRTRVQMFLSTVFIKKKKIQQRVSKLYWHSFFNRVSAVWTHMYILWFTASFTAQSIVLYMTSISKRLGLKKKFLIISTLVFFSGFPGGVIMHSLSECVQSVWSVVGEHLKLKMRSVHDLTHKSVRVCVFVNIIHVRVPSGKYMGYIWQSAWMEMR